MSAEDYEISDHAREEALRRDIPLQVLQEVVESPGQVVSTHTNRLAYQSQVEINGKLYVIRAIVEDTAPLRVITVYRTSKVEKYWRPDDESNL
jgi:hypothetical protein